MESVLEHVDSVDHTLAEAYRVLRPGGVLHVTTTNRLQLSPTGQNGEYRVRFFNWLPAHVKESYVVRHLHYDPSLANYTPRPAVHWFTYPELCAHGRRAGFATFYSFLDLIDEERDASVATHRLKRWIIRNARNHPWFRALVVSQMAGNPIFMYKRAEGAADPAGLDEPAGDIHSRRTPSPESFRGPVVPGNPRSRDATQPVVYGFRDTRLAPERRRMPSRDPIVLPSVATDADLVSAPIRPSWILEGSPQARSRFLGFIDGSALTATIWETTAGRFEWHYGADELVHILDGEVEITPPGGGPILLKAGDVIFFPGGQIMHWHVRDHVKKMAINSVQVSPIRQLATRVPFAKSLVRRLRSARRHG